MSSVKQSSGLGKPLSRPASKKSITGLREAATRGKGVRRVNEGHPARWRLVPSEEPTN
jgi:hypothetical protein